MPERREDLKRAYKENPPAMGVFLVRNLRTNRYVAGASRNVEGSLNRYRFMLQMGKPGDPFLKYPDLMTDYKNLGADAFEFLVLDTLKPKDEPGWDPGDDLNHLERLWKDELTARSWEAYGSARKQD